MLILTRKPDEAIKIGKDVTVKVIAVRGSVVHIGIDAPKDTNIVRTEIIGKPKRGKHETDGNR